MEWIRETLLKHADIALYRAKRQARGTLQFFEFRHDANARDRWTIEQDLRRALERDEFFLVYQPVLELNTQRIVACEALIRWRHPTRGIVKPLDFVEIAEQAGLIDAIGNWVVRKACHAAASWPTGTHVAVKLLGRTIP